MIAQSAHCPVSHYWPSELSIANISHQIDDGEERGNSRKKKKKKKKKKKERQNRKEKRRAEAREKESVKQCDVCFPFLILSSFLFFLNIPLPFPSLSFPVSGGRKRKRFSLSLFHNTLTMGSRQRQDYDHIIKLLVIGDSGVGKTSLLLRFSEDSFTTSFISTIGIDFKIKKVMIDEKCCKLQIWDTAGQERFRTITKAYYRGSMGIMLVYDTTDEKSFNNVRNWMKNIEQNAAPNVNKVRIHTNTKAQKPKK